jgi:hypothetical protein
VAQVLQQGVQVEIQERVRELEEQELPLQEGLLLQQEEQVLQEEVLEQALALGQAQAQALLAQAQAQVLGLEVRVQALAGLLEQVQAEVEDLVEPLQQEGESALVEEQAEAQVLRLVQAVPQE